MGAYQCLILRKHRPRHLTAHLLFAELSKVRVLSRDTVSEKNLSVGHVESTAAVIDVSRDL